MSRLAALGIQTAQPVSSFIGGQQARQQSELQRLQIEQLPKQYAQQNRLAELNINSAEQKASDQRQLREALPGAMEGNKDDMGTVAKLDFDTWNKLDENQKAEAKANHQVMSWAAGTVLAAPPDQREQLYQQLSPLVANRLGIDQAEIPPFNEARLQLMANELRDMEDIIAGPKPNSTQQKVIAAGLDPNTPEGQAYARKLLEKSGSSITINNTPKLPSGYQWQDPDNIAAGMEPVPGGPADSQNVADASKTAMIESAMQSAQAFGEMIMPGGKVDRGLIGQMQANVPFSEGRQARVLIKDAIEAKLRAESGAAVPDSEVSRAAERFMPSVLDNEATIQQKMALLQEFLSDAMTNIRPDRGGKGREGAKEPTQDKQRDRSSAKLMEDANGNRAYVYPDGTVEEL